MSDFLDGRVVEWLTAIGTVGSAVAAVWLGIRQVLGAAGPGAKLYGGGAPDTFVVELANVGLGAVVVNGVSWRTGWWCSSDPIHLPLSTAACPPYRIDQGASRAVPMLLNDLKRTVIPALRDSASSHRALLVTLATGKVVRCRLTREARSWIQHAITGQSRD
jgi:hypothetical protein